MKTISLKFIDEDLQESLLPYLEGLIFHYTTQDAYRKILADGRIKHNKDNKFELGASSGNSYGRKRGYICVFNLKEIDREVINHSLLYHYNFLEPPWFKKYYKDRTESKLVFLVVNNKYQDLLVGSKEALGSPDHHVPKIECWFCDHIPINHIERVVSVDIVRSVPKDPVLYAHHMMNLEAQTAKNKQITNALTRPE